MLRFFHSLYLRRCLLEGLYGSRWFFFGFEFFFLSSQHEMKLMYLVFSFIGEKISFILHIPLRRSIAGA